MPKLYIAFIGVFIALFIYAGATGNFGIIPRLTLDVPFVGQMAPPSQTLLAPMLLPDRSGPIGVNAGQFFQHLERGGAKVSWERSADQRSWILRYGMYNQLTNTSFKGAGRLVVLADATEAGVHGTATVFDAWAEDGDEFTLAEVYATVLSIATAIKQGWR